MDTLPPLCPGLHIGDFNVLEFNIITGIENIFTILKVVSSSETVNHFNDAYNNCTIRYGDLKKQLVEDIINFTNPIREKIKSISADETFLSKVVKEGAEKAQVSAAKTIKDVREIIGIKSF